MMPRHLLAVIALALLSFTPAFAADPLLNWVKSPEAYYATPDELAKWKKEVATAQDAQKFIDEYYRVRGGEAFRKDLHARIEFADSKFGLAKIPGSKTAMGRVWILLGSPNETKTNRTGAAGGALNDNSVESGSRVTYSWVYKKDRLPAELGRSELKVDFNTDVSRGFQEIENPGLVEPYLKRAAAHFTSKFAAAAASPSTTPSPHVATPAKPAAAATPSPVWNITPALNGAIYTADAFVSPKEDPMYAVSFFIPADAAPFKLTNSVLAVSAIRDASGTEVVAKRDPVELAQYDDAGNHYVDRSFALAPGKYEGTFALYSPDGATLLASHRETFEVPAATAPRVSKLLLTSHVDTLETQEPLDPFTFVAQKYAIRGDHRFRASDRISLITIVANPTGSPTPQLMQKLSFTRDGKPSAKMPLEPAQVTQTGPNTFLVGAAFDPNTFKPGHYTVELQVRDFNAPEGSELRTKGYVLNAEFDVIK